MICSPLRILKLLLLTARMLFYGAREKFFNEKIELSRFAPVNCPYERVFKGAVSGAWPDKLSLNIGTPRQVLFTTWRDELKSFERALYSFRFQLFFLKLASQASARTSTFCRPVSRYSIALNNLTIEERNNPV